ncbi:MAG: ImmA/IrrE family metallo-endopeptidase [Fimbriimonadaceae bacterium]|nr:ImmA/IrrE family metallo-endopeptidase [Fimbriimonadaceae bacterium]
MLRGVMVMAQDYTGLDGSLIRSGKHGIIGYRRGIQEAGRIAFTIAHELGHWELHPHHNQAIACTAGDIAAYKGTGMEQEANAFAAELLMPTPMLAQSLQYASATIQQASKVANTYGTSLTAAAIRVIELIDCPALVVLSEDNRVKWVAKSRKARPYFTVQKGDPINDEALAWNCLAEIDEVEPPERVKANAWFTRDHNSYRLTVWEQSAMLGDYNLVLSVVSFDEQ